MLVNVRNSAVKWITTVAPRQPSSELIYISTCNGRGASKEISCINTHVGVIIVITILSNYLFMTAGVV